MSLYGHLPDDFAGKGLNPKKCAVANMTGLVPDVPVMHFPPCSVENLTKTISPIENGGLLNNSGVVEVVSCIDESGIDVPNSLRWGIFIVLTTDNSYLRSCLRDYGMEMDDSGKYGAMYHPHHLVGMETPISIPSACIRGELTGAPKARIGHVAAVAKRPLNPGDVLDGEGGYTVYGQLEKYSRARSQNILPVGLCHNARVNKTH